MSARITLAMAGRVLAQLRHDHRTLAMLLVVPCALMTLLWWIFEDRPAVSSTGSAPALLALFPFIIMFLVTSVTTLRERVERHARAAARDADGQGRLPARLRARVRPGRRGPVGCSPSALSVGLLGLEVAGPVWLLGLVAVVDAVLGTALGLFVSAFAATEFQAVQFMPAVVLPQLLLCGLFVPRDALPDAWRRSATSCRCRTPWTRCRPSTRSSEVADVWGDLGVVLAFVARRARAGRRDPPGEAQLPRRPARSLCPMSLLRQPLLLLSRSTQVKNLVSTLPVSSGIVHSYVPGESTESPSTATAELVDDGLTVTLDYLGRGHPRRRAGRRHRGGVRRPARSRSRPRGLTRRAEVSVKLSAVGQALPATSGAQGRPRERPRHLPSRAQRRHHGHPRHGGPHHHRLDARRSCASCARTSPRPAPCCRPTLRRTEADCRALADEGSRVRLCKGAYLEPEAVAFQERLDVDKSYVRCLKVLIAGEGYPMIATHDPRMVEIASSLASRYGRAKGTYEFQMLYGIRPDRAAPAGRSRGDDARLHPLRHRVVRLPHAPSRRATRPTCHSS